MREYRIAYFISPHGFGHSTRAAAVMSALGERAPFVRFELFTHAPQWLFKDSFSALFNYNSLLTDVGFVQTTSLREDIPKTVESLQKFLPFTPSHLASLADVLNRKKCELIVCDIAPMGIAVGQKANIPSILIENFTWDWIYGKYAHHNTQILRYSTYLETLFKAVDYHIQTEPVCSYTDAHLTANPISRKMRTPPAQVRERLGIPLNVKLAMITMGGVPEHYGFLDELRKEKSIYFLIAGGGKSMKLYDNLIIVPYQSEFFHPDLINASDMVIGKAGYSTLAEVYHAGVPFGYIMRPHFPESKVLARYIKKYLNGVQLTEEQFYSGNWKAHLEELCAMPRINRNETNGADEVAEFISKFISNVIK
ncbi:MAG: glycosyltransferase family protein [bacterium]